LATKQSEKYKRGDKLRRKTLGNAGEERKRLLEAFHPDLMRYPIEFAFGDVLSRPGLNHKTRELITLALAIGNGVEREVRSHTRGFLNHGGTKKRTGRIADPGCRLRRFPQNDRRRLRDH